MQQQPPLLPVLPYSLIVGQQSLKLALELVAYIAPRLGGVLLSGHRGTGKSTAVRAFLKWSMANFQSPCPLMSPRIGWWVDGILIN